MADWRRERLLHPILLLNSQHREIVAQEIERHCSHRGWHLWVVNPRSNHVHIVVTAKGFDGARVRDQLKANCTRALREFDIAFIDRPVWSRGGDWKCINTEDDLSTVVVYSSDAQDAKAADS